VQIVRFLLRVIRRVLTIALVSIAVAFIILAADVCLGVPVWACNWLAVAAGAGMAYYLVWRDSTWP
jgi:hypothetical protein